MVNKEIERKWLIQSAEDMPPEYKVKERVITKQSYLGIDPEVRIRSSTKKLFGKTVTDYFMTIKSDGTLSRTEVEFHIDKKKYDAIQNIIGKSPIVKNLKIYHIDGHEIFVASVNIDGQHGFTYAEIEFRSEEEAKEYVWPWGNPKDVTYDTSYKMKNVWKAYKQ